MKFLACCFGVFLSTALVAGTMSPVELRVRATAGGPQLFLDGKAVGTGPRLRVPFEKGELRVFRVK